MTPRDWHRAKEIFHAALEHASPQRPGYVRGACGADEALRDEVERLLCEHERSGVFLQTQRAGDLFAGPAVLETAATPNPAMHHSGSAAEESGTQIGRYRLLRLLGEGGFGTVWLAEQCEPVRRKVALKIIKLGMDTRQVIARFEAERQALAVMDHPHVAKVFDAGATETGRPYFVMEHVQGVPITEHCERHELNLFDRLTLFIQVCEAVQHAHQKGIIHRDIKPSNILVAMADRDVRPIDGKSPAAGPPVGVPKVIDFGISKAITSPLTGRTVFTDQGQLIGTPAYMSPEQADTSGQDIDTRTDIYSLGVLLYELLTGALPFDPTSLQNAGLADLQRIIREIDPPTPSTKLSHQRTGRPASKLIRGDLDWITMKALEKDRSRRYASVSDLAADVRRHLAHEPVTAGPPSGFYRFRKFVRRNRGSVFATSVIVGLSMVGMTAVLMALNREAKQRSLAKAAEYIANEKRVEAEDARFIAEFLTQTLHAASPSQMGRDARVIDVVERAAESIKELSQKPLLEAGVREAIGQVYAEWNELTKAETHLSAAVEIFRKYLPELHRDRLVAENNLGGVRLRRDELKSAEALFRSAYEGLNSTLGEGNPDTLAAANNLANTYLKTERFADAERILSQSVAAARAQLGDEHEQTQRSVTNLGRSYRALGRYREAEERLTSVLEVRRRLYGEKNVNTINSMINLGVLYKTESRFSEAEPLYQQAMEAQRHLLGAEHPETLNTWNNLLSLYLAQCRYEEAAAQAAVLVAAARRTFAERHNSIGLALRIHGEALTGLGQFAEAEDALLAALEILESSSAPQHVRGALVALIALYDACNRPDQAACWRPLIPQSAQH